MNLPLKTAQAGRGGGDLPRQAAFVEVKPVAIMISAMKKCEHRDSLVLRLFNPMDAAVEGKVSSYWPVTEAWLTNMNEERREQLAVAQNAVHIRFAPKKIITCELVLDNEPG